MSTQFHGKPFRIHITMQDNGLLQADCNTHVVTDVSSDELEYIYMPYAGINAQVELICDIPEIKEQVKQALIVNTNLSHLLSSDHPVFEHIFINTLNSYTDGSCSLNSLKSILNADIPVIIVGAGPALDSDRIKWLQEQRLADKAVIIGCGSANRILCNNNVYPHFALAFDPHQTEVDALESLSKDYLDNVPLICTTGLHNKIFDLGWCKKFVVPSRSFPVLGKELEPNSDIIEEGCSGCVTMAVNLVDYLGSSKIVTLGVDLCFGKDNRLYADSEGPDDSGIPMIEQGSKITKEVWINEAHYIINRGKELGIEVITASSSLLNEYGVPLDDNTQFDSDVSVEALLPKEIAPKSEDYTNCVAKLTEIHTYLYLAKDGELCDDFDNTLAYGSIVRSWDVLQQFREVRGCEYNKHLIKDLVANVQKSIMNALKNHK